MTASLGEVLTPLMRQRGMQGCLVASESDGLVIESRLQQGTDGDALAALAASLFRQARLSARAAGLGAVTYLRVEAAGGLFCVAGGGDLLLAALADRGANAGLIRVEMLKSGDALFGTGLPGSHR